MNAIESINPLGTQPAVSPTSQRYGSAAVVLALAVIAGLVVYFIQRQLALSVEGKNIEDSFKKPPKSLSWLDLRCLAQAIESLKLQEMRPNERYKVAIGLIRKKFIVSLGPDNVLHVQYIRKKLGQGGFGKVFKLIDLHTGAKTALKVAEIPEEFKHGEMPTEYKGREEYVKRAYLNAAEEDLRKEHSNLMIVHQSGKPVLGVQDKPLTPILTITKCYDSASKVRLAFEETIYEGSLDKLDIEKLPVKTRLYIALQVLQGMRTLAHNDLVSHDLKPQNVLFRGSVVHVSDLGGVTHKDDLSEELKKGLPHTPAYADTETIELAATVPIKFLQKKLVKHSEKCTIGLTICWILTGNLLEDINSIDTLWQQAGLSDKAYSGLLKALKAVFKGGFAATFFVNNVKALKKEVKKVYKQSSQSL